LVSEDAKSIVPLNPESTAPNLLTAVTVKLNTIPGNTIGGIDRSNVSVVGGQRTAILAEPVTDGAAKSTPLIDTTPTVFRVAWNILAPPSLGAKAKEPGIDPRGSVVVMATVPTYPGTSCPKALTAVTVTVKLTPTVTDTGAANLNNEADSDGATAMHPLAEEATAAIPQVIPLAVMLRQISPTPTAV
jgi:hypothetical protein